MYYLAGASALHSYNNAPGPRFVVFSCGLGVAVTINFQDYVTINFQDYFMGTRTLMPQWQCYNSEEYG